MDTNALSAFAPARSPRPPIDAELQGWLNRNSDNFFLSVVTIMEIETGVRRLGRKSPGQFHERLHSWFLSVLEFYADRVLPVDLDVARIASALADRAAALGLDPGAPDILIAATATTNGCTLVTRSTRHFAPLGIAVLDPFASTHGLYP